MGPGHYGFSWLRDVEESGAALLEIGLTEVY
jgi:hypothetical protein